MTSISKQDVGEVVPSSCLVWFRWRYVRVYSIVISRDQKIATQYFDWMQFRLTDQELDQYVMNQTNRLTS